MSGLTTIFSNLLHTAKLGGTQARSAASEQAARTSVTATGRDLAIHLPPFLQSPS